MSNSRIAALASCLILSAIGCRTAVPLSSPADDLLSLHARTLLLTDNDYSVVRMTGATFASDTIVGLVNGRMTAIPLSRLNAVREVVTSPTKTAGLAALIGGGVAAALLIARP